jgi:hypothetical protein
MNKGLFESVEKWAFVLEKLFWCIPVAGMCMV